MISWIDMVNFAFAVCGMLVTLLGLFMSRSVTHLDRWARLFFRAVFSIALAYTVSDLVSQISLLFLGPQYRLLSAAAVFGESLLSSLLMPLMTLYLLYSLKKPWRKSLSFRLAVFLWGVYLVLLVVNLFVPEFYVITGQNVYQRKPLYPVLLVPPILLMSVNLFVLFRNWKVFTRRQRQAFASYLLIPLICMLLQSLAYGLLMIVIGTSAAVMLMFIFILRDQFEQYLLQKEENTRQRNSIMVLQMRPHFIYNTMTSIYYLCKQDSDKAQQVILDFTSYLRSNFTAVAREDTVAFSEEMEHTRAYLAVEQVRFEGRLSVEFDTPYTSFRIPPLTLQPIVENAVKHGVDPDMDPLHITVRTRKSSHGNEIIVEDNGPGFGPSDNADPHIALNNIRERLKIMCNGSLHISAREGGGTVVTIVV